MRCSLSILVLAICALLAAAQDQSPSSRPVRNDRLPLGSTTPRSERFRDVLAIEAMVDARADRYRDEINAQEFERVVRELFAAFIEQDREACERQASKEAKLRGSLHASATPVFDDGNFVVRDAAPIDPAQESRSLIEEFSRWRERLGEKPEIVIACIAIDQEGTATRATFVVTAFGKSDGRAVQENVTLHLERGGDAERRIVGGEVLTYQHVSAKTALYVDETARVIPDVATRRILDRDAWDIVNHFDRAHGTDLLGHVGLAVGDVNGDGREDLWVGTQGGLPNLLLVQDEGGRFVDRAKEAGVDFLDMTRAALLVDMDGDGDRDLVMSVRNGTVILANDGKGRFAEKPLFAARTGAPSEFYSIAAVDQDKNGFLDLYSVRYVSAGYGISIPLPYFDAENGPANLLLSNFGEGNFRDDTTAAGLGVNNSRFSLAASFADVDDDGDQDLYVANDFGRSNLWINGEKGFTDETMNRGALNQAAGMGVSFGDYDADGILDLYVTNMYSPAGMRIMRSHEFRPADDAAKRRLSLGHAMGNSLFRGLGSGRFEERSDAARPEVNGWAWGGLFADINGDGLEDLLVPNGNLTGPDPTDLDSLFWRQVAARSPWTVEPSREYENGWAALSRCMGRGLSWAGRQRNATYLNIGGGRFADVSRLSGFGYLDDGRALALSDVDQDGDLDLWVRNRTSPGLRFLRNRTRESIVRRNAVTFALLHADGRRAAIGASLDIESKGRHIVRAVRAGEGYLAQSSDRVVVGLGDMTSIERASVRFPSGNVAKAEGLGADRHYVWREGSAPIDAGPIVVGDAGDAAPGFELKEPHPPGHGTSTGVVLAERMAWPARTFTANADVRVSTDNLLGGPYVLVLWSGRSERSMRALETIHAAAREFGDAKVQVLPLCVDDDEHIATAIAAAAAIDPGLPPFRIDDETLDIIDLTLQDVLGSPRELELPAIFAFDELGLLAGMFLGEGGPMNWIAACRSKEAQGRIVYPAQRNYAFIARELQTRGRRGSATWFQGIARRRR